MTEKIMIDSLSCKNCPEKERCKEQQKKKDTVLLEIINYIKELIRPEYHKHLDVLWENIPKITRCDVVLQKQLEKKMAECEKLNSKYNCYSCGTCKDKEDYTNTERHFKNLQNSYEKVRSKLQIATEALKNVKQKIFEDRDMLASYEVINEALERIKNER